jgi:hypothetical protein
MEFEHKGAGRRDPTAPEAKTPDQQQALPEVGKGRCRVRPPEPEQIPPPIESAEANSSAPITPKQKSRREEKRQYYLKNRAEKLAYQERYRKGHKTENRVYQREYMRDYREGNRRRLQAEQQQPIQVQVFPSP